jgi:hypothetical protein
MEDNNMTSVYKKECTDKLNILVDRIYELAVYDKKRSQSYDLGTFDEFKDYVKDINNGKDLYEMLFDLYKSVDTE